MSKYVVKSIDRLANFDAQNEDMLKAEDIRNEYGLTFIPVEKVKILWQEYSESMCAGWMLPDKESVEQVFGVTLEEINDE